MSTKIYDAYRIPKSVDVLKFLKKGKEIATKLIAEDDRYLKYLHSNFIQDVVLKRAVETDENKIKRLDKIINDNKNKAVFDHDWEFNDFLERGTLNTRRIDLSCEFSCSVFYDKKYWYLKFFPNSYMDRKVLKVLEEDMEDFHYQNQSDPPEDIPYKTYKAREKKWDELTESSGGNYIDGFQYDLISPYLVRKLISKFYYTGKPLYDHLAYKFDEVFFKEETKNEQNTGA